jgi:hypothetical protein
VISNFLEVAICVTAKMKEVWQKEAMMLDEDLAELYQVENQKTE